jgi:ubiquinone/menaquinone biosynthesis C-methylase UbiE
MGTADVMRRMALPNLVRAMTGIEHPRILDLGCGTGRFIYQLHRALPRALLYGLDLSPDYLKQAQVVLSGVKSISLVQENAESLSFKDQSFDAVTSVFLFHELPGDARRNVMREAFRVLRPGGIFVILDSAQLSESKELEFFLEGFPTLYHEPYFKGYVRDDLGAALRELGFSVQKAEPHFVSKLVVAVKPAGTPQR